MNKIKTQEERLTYLLEEFRADSDSYKNIKVPDNISEKEKLLRSLMNIRMPKRMSEEVIKVQDEYLSCRAEKKGIESHIHPRAVPSGNWKRQYADRLRWRIGQKGIPASS